MKTATRWDLQVVQRVRLYNAEGTGLMTGQGTGVPQLHGAAKKDRSEDESQAC